MRATIPPGDMPQDLVDNCLALAGYLRVFCATTEELAAMFPAQSDRLGRIVREVDRFFQEARLSDGVTLAQLLVASELRAGGRG